MMPAFAVPEKPHSIPGPFAPAPLRTDLSAADFQDQYHATSSHFPNTINNYNMHPNTINNPSSIMKHPSEEEESDPRLLEAMHLMVLQREEHFRRMHTSRVEKVNRAFRCLQKKLFRHSQAVDSYFMSMRAEMLGVTSVSESSEFMREKILAEPSFMFNNDFGAGTTSADTSNSSFCERGCFAKENTSCVDSSFTSFDNNNTCADKRKLHPRKKRKKKKETVEKVTSRKNENSINYQENTTNNGKVTPEIINAFAEEITARAFETAFKRKLDSMKKNSGRSGKLKSASSSRTRESRRKKENVSRTQRDIVLFNNIPRQYYASDGVDSKTFNNDSNIYHNSSHPFYQDHCTSYPLQMNHNSNCPEDICFSQSEISTNSFHPHSRVKNGWPGRNSQQSHFQRDTFHQQTDPAYSSNYHQMPEFVFQEQLKPQVKNKFQASQNYKDRKSYLSTVCSTTAGAFSKMSNIGASSSSFFPQSYDENNYKSQNFNNPHSGSFNNQHNSNQYQNQNSKSLFFPGDLSTVISNENESSLQHNYSEVKNNNSDGFGLDFCNSGDSRKNEQQGQEPQHFFPTLLQQPDNENLIDCRNSNNSIFNTSKENANEIITENPTIFVVKTFSNSSSSSSSSSACSNQMSFSAQALYPDLKLTVRNLDMDGSFEPNESQNSDKQKKRNTLRNANMRIRAMREKEEASIENAKILRSMLGENDSSILRTSKVFSK